MFKISPALNRFEWFKPGWGPPKFMHRVGLGPCVTQLY